MKSDFCSWRLLTRCNNSGIFAGLTENGQDIVLASWSSAVDTQNSLKDVRHVRGFGVVSNTANITKMIAEGFLNDRSHYVSIHQDFPEQGTPSVSAGAYWGHNGPIVTVSLVCQCRKDYYDRDFFVRNPVAGSGYGMAEFRFDEVQPFHDTPIAAPLFGDTLSDVTRFLRSQIHSEFLTVKLLPKE